MGYAVETMGWECGALPGEFPNSPIFGRALISNMKTVSLIGTILSRIKMMARKTWPMRLFEKPLNLGQTAIVIKSTKQI